MATKPQNVPYVKEAWLSFNDSYILMQHMYPQNIGVKFSVHDICRTLLQGHELQDYQMKSIKSQAQTLVTDLSTAHYLRPCIM